MLPSVLCTRWLSPYLPGHVLCWQSKVTKEGPECSVELSVSRGSNLMHRTSRRLCYWQEKKEHFIKPCICVISFISHQRWTLLLFQPSGLEFQIYVLLNIKGNRCDIDRVGGRFDLILLYLIILFIQVFFLYFLTKVFSLLLSFLLDNNQYIF